MNILRKWIRFLFGFSRRETNGFLILLPLIMLVLFSQPLYKALTRSDSKDFSRERVKLDSLVAILKDKGKPGRDSATIQTKTLFEFNPNTVSLHQLNQLGFKTEIISRMINYREKGGKFFVKSDLLKIYGMDSITYKQLYSYINLPTEKNPVKVVSQLENTNPKNEAKFDLNVVDSVRLLKIYGIGPVLSSRIIRYRDKLGGFISPDQLFEVYGLDSAVVQRVSNSSLMGDSLRLRKINLNSDDAEWRLAAHPYLSKSKAKVIVAYRFQHGPFSLVEDIRKIHGIDEKTFLKIEPYLTVKEAH